MATFKPRPTIFAKRLRNNATDAERLLWRHLSRRQLGSYKFSRQFPIGRFVVDLICREQKLIVEVDGGQHGASLEVDDRRTNALEDEGYRVIRFWNNDVMGNIEGVFQSIQNALAGPPPTPPASGRGARPAGAPK